MNYKDRTYLFNSSALNQSSYHRVDQIRPMPMSTQKQSPEIILPGLLENNPMIASSKDTFYHNGIPYKFSDKGIFANDYKINAIPIIVEKPVPMYTQKIGIMGAFIKVLKECWKRAGDVGVIIERNDKGLEFKVLDKAEFDRYRKS